MSLVYINDSNYQQYINPTINGTKYSCEYYGMWRSQEGYRSAKGFEALGIDLIPKDEWKDRIQHKINSKTTTKDLTTALRIPHLDQGQTNYCWINGVVHGTEIRLAQTTGIYTSLSPASGGARIKNFRNVGGWGDEALDWMMEHGINETKDWPANAIDRRYNTPENQQKALRYRVTEWIKIESWDELVTCLLNDIRCGAGYNWWAHLICACDLNMNLDLIIRNSWRGWGDDGYGVLQGSRKYPDGACAVISTLAA